MENNEWEHLITPSRDLRGKVNETQKGKLLCSEQICLHTTPTRATPIPFLHIHETTKNLMRCSFSELLEFLKIHEFRNSVYVTREMIFWLSPPTHKMLSLSNSKAVLSTAN